MAGPVTVLITGADGFAGRCCCPVLADAGHRVVGITRKPPAAGSLPAHPAIALRAVGDIGPDTDWGDTLRGVDAVIHLANRAHVLHETAKDPMREFRRVNVSGTARLCKMAAGAGVRRFLYISSIGVNGRGTKENPFSESDRPNPQDPYAVSKWEAEERLRQISAEDGIELVILRPPLMYGPGVKGNFLRLLKLVDAGVPLPLGGVGNRRSFLGAGNLAHLLERCLTHPSAAGNMFVASDGEDLSTTELVSAIAIALGRPARLFRVPAALMRHGSAALGKKREFEQLCGSLVVDSRKVRDTLDWTPPFSVREGLARMAQWFLGARERG